MTNIKDHQSVCAGGCSQKEPKESFNGKQQPGSITKNRECIEKLKQMFPDVLTIELEGALEAAMGDVNQAADVILQKCAEDDKDDASDDVLMYSPFEEGPTCDDRAECSDDISTDNSLSSIISELSKKLTGPVMKIHIDQRFVLLDALPIYKDPAFDATCPLRVSFSKQPAIDIGGPKREFFTSLFEEIAGGQGEVVPALFEGPDGRLMPIYSSSILYSGLMTAVGKMIAHSIAQCGVGFPYLSPVCYWYLITEDVRKAIGYANITDIRDIDVADLIQKLLNTNEEDMVDLGKDSSVIALLSDAGCNGLPSIDNRQLLVESLMLHTTLSKRKVILDQLRKGLKTLDVLDYMIERPLVFECLFVRCAEDITPGKVTRCLSFLCENDLASSKNYLLQFLEESTQKELQTFLRFATGAATIPPGPGKIKVYFDSIDGTMFASTCLIELHMPPSFESYEEFKIALSAVIAVDPANSFNTV